MLIEAEFTPFSEDGLLGSFNIDNTSSRVLINWLFPS